MPLRGMDPAATLGPAQAAAARADDPDPLGSSTSSVEHGDRDRGVDDSPNGPPNTRPPTDACGPRAMDDDDDENDAGKQMKTKPLPARLRDVHKSSVGGDDDALQAHATATAKATASALAPTLITILDRLASLEKREAAREAAAAASPKVSYASVPPRPNRSTSGNDGAWPTRANRSTSANDAAWPAIGVSNSSDNFNAVQPEPQRAARVATFSSHVLEDDLASEGTPRCTSLAPAHLSTTSDTPGRERQQPNRLSVSSAFGGGGMPSPRVATGRGRLKSRFAPDTVDPAPTGARVGPRKSIAAAMLMESDAPFTSPFGSRRGTRRRTTRLLSAATVDLQDGDFTALQVDGSFAGDATALSPADLLSASVRPPPAGGDGEANPLDSDSDTATKDAKPPTRITSMSSAGAAAKPQTLRDRLSSITGVSPTHPAVTAVDVLYMLSTLLATCVALEATVLPDAGPTTVPVARAILLCCHAFMLVWTATRFLVHTCDGWDVCATAGDIAKVYARGWLRFDAAVALPLDWPLAWAYPPAFFGLQLRHALRFARFPSLAHSGNPLASSRRGLRLLAQLVVVALVVDVCAVLFAVVEGTTYWSALYWAVSTTTSVSYGDVLPSDSGSARVLACCAMVAGVAMVAALTAGFTAALTRQDARMQAEDDRKQLLASMLAYYEVPWDEQMELIAMFPAVLDAENRRSFKGLLENLPGFMVEKIEGFAMAKAVTESIPLFRDCERGALSDLTRRLDHRFYQAGEVIVQAGAEGFEMYFLVRGTADVLASLPAGVTAVVATLRNGAFFGEVALVTESCVRTASVVAVTPAEVLVLDKQAYLELVAAHASIGRVFDAVTEQARARAAANQKKPDCESEAEDAAPALALSCSTADAHSAACTNNDNGSGDPDADQPLKLPADSYSSTAGRGPPTVTSAHPPPPSGNDDGDGDGSDGGQFSNPFASR